MPLLPVVGRPQAIVVPRVEENDFDVLMIIMMILMLLRKDIF